MAVRHHGGQVRIGVLFAGGSRSPELQQALNDAAQAMKDGQSAMKNGDWTAYGEAQKELKRPSTRPSSSTVASNRSDRNWPPSG